MERSQIIKKLNEMEYSVLGDNRLILMEDKKRIHTVGEIATTEISKYLGRVILYQITNNNRQEMLELEHFLIDNKIPYNHEE